MASSDRPGDGGGIGGDGRPRGGNRSAAARARERAQQGPAPRPPRAGAQVRAGQGQARAGQGKAGQGKGRPVENRRGPGRRPAQRQRSTAVTAGIFGGAFVVLAAVIIIVISLVGGSSGPVGPGHDPYIKPFPATSSIVNAIEHVPSSELAAAGSPSSVSNVGPKGSGANIVRVNAPLASGGKPLVVYVGAEYCPYCAATRWALAIALDRFGTLSGLQQTASSPIDAYPSTHTLSFAKATYTSKYLAFDETEETTNACTPGQVVSNPSPPPSYLCNNGAYTLLQTPSKQAQNLVTTYDTPTWFGALDSNGAGIPFIDVGGKFVESGALYDPQLLQGANWSQIVAAFKVPTAGIGQAILGSANRYIAMLCEVTHDRPASVCSQAYAKAARKALG